MSSPPSSPSSICFWNRLPLLLPQFSHSTKKRGASESLSPYEKRVTYDNIGTAILAMASVADDDANNDDEDEEAEDDDEEVEDKENDAAVVTGAAMPAPDPRAATAATTGAFLGAERAAAKMDAWARARAWT